MDIYRICQNCSFFFPDPDDLHLGVCIQDEAFEPFLEEIIETEDFSSCCELFIQKRFNGDKEACSLFEVPEMLDIPEGEDIRPFLIVENMKHQNVDGIIEYLFSSNPKEVRAAISAISAYVYVGNAGAYEGVIKYYESLGPAKDLEDVNLRVKIVGLFQQYESETRTVEAYINELARTPSNNTTRKLYTLILERLGRCSAEVVSEMLLQLLSKKQYSARMKKRILEVAGF